MPKIKIDAKIPISILREGKNFIVYSPALDLSSSAKNYKQALSRFNEAVEIFFEEALKRRTLKEVLEELGWRRVRTKWQPPLVISQDIQRIRIAS
jgi:predicted Zn-dependent protease